MPRRSGTVSYVKRARCICVWSARRRYRVAHVSVYSGRPFIWAWLVCYLLRKVKRPYVLTLHGGALPVFARRFPGAFAGLLESAATVTAPSRYLQDEMRRFRPDIVMLRNPLHLHWFNHRLRARATPRIIWVRSLHSMYNPRLAIDVIARLQPAFPDIQLTMLGPEREKGILDALREDVKQRGLEGQVRFILGVPREDVGNWLAAADVFLNTTDIDNAPVSVVEAMAAGLCVVTTDAGGVPHM